MTLQELRYLVALADKGHFVRAAEACHVGQPTLSTQIKKLEDYLGVTLFERNKHQLMPTPIGEEIIQCARVALDVVEQIRELARQGRDPMDGPLRVGVIPTLGPYLVPHLLPPLRDAFPKLHLFLREDLTVNLLERLRQGRLDALLLALPVHGEDIETMALFSEPFTVALPKGHALENRKYISEKDLALQNVLLLEEGHCMREQALAICGSSGSDQRDELKATSLETLRQMVAAELKRWARQIEEKADWRHIREDVEVKVCRGPEGKESFLLRRSASRVEKEKAMHGRFIARIDEGLAKLSPRIERSKKALDRGALERQIGRLLERNSRAAGGFSIAIAEDDKHPSGLALRWTRRPEWADWARYSEGVYILRTNIAEWTDEALWKTYLQLTEAEAAFRIQKSDLAIRPIWHHKPARIKAHILVCFIAHALWKTLQQWQSRAGLGHAPRTILEEFSRIHAADIVLPLADASKRELRIRCVVRPDQEQAILLQHLGLTLPERLRPPSIPQM